MRKEAVLYTLGRVGFFLIVALLVFAVTGLLGHQLNGLPLLLVALLLSSIGSLWLLRGQRQKLATAMAEAREARTAELARRRARLENDS